MSPKIILLIYNKAMKFVIHNLFKHSILFKFKHQMSINDNNTYMYFLEFLFSVWNTCEQFCIECLTGKQLTKFSLFYTIDCKINRYTFIALCRM